MSSVNATGEKPKRRERSSKPGIFFRINKSGRRTYEFQYRDAHGKQQYEGGFATLKEAEAARGEILRRKGRGERIAPIKVSFVEFAYQWLDSQTELRDSTRKKYEWAIRVHLAPRLGKATVAAITEDVVSGVIADMHAAGLAPATITAVLAPLSLILGRAVRRGAIAKNAVSGLERNERPKSRRRELRILGRDEIDRLIVATDPDQRALMATLIFAGLRISEALGLRWSDVDIENGQIHVRGQLDHKLREYVATKTPNGVRSVVLMPTLGSILAAHRLAAKFSSDSDAVFATSTGTPGNRDNVRNRVVAPAVRRAGLDNDGRPKLRTHDLRHCFASILIAGGGSVVFVSRQLGHASPSITLDIYSHLFDERDHGAKMAEILESGFGNALSTAYRGAVQSSAVVPLNPAA